MTIELRVGGYYKRRDGEVVGPLRLSRDVDYPFTDGDRTWQADGRYHADGPDSMFDLVAEADCLSAISDALKRIAEAVTALQQQVDAIRKETQP